MKIYLLLFVLSSGVMSFRTNPNILNSNTSISLLQKPSVEELREVIKRDLGAKVGEVVELLATDLEKALTDNNLLAAPSYLQRSEQLEKVKVLVKSTFIKVLRHVLPILELWVHESLLPPKVSKLIYNSIVQPICFSITEELNNKLKITAGNPWKKDVEEEDDGLGDLDLGGGGEDLDVFG